MRGTGCDIVNIPPYWSQNKKYFLHFAGRLQNRIQYLRYDFGASYSRKFSLLVVFGVLVKIAILRNK